MATTKSQPERVCTQHCGHHPEWMRGNVCEYPGKRGDHSSVVCGHVCTFSEPPKRPCGECGETEFHAETCERVPFSISNLGSPIAVLDAERVHEPVATDVEQYSICDKCGGRLYFAKTEWRHIVNRSPTCPAYESAPQKDEAADWPQWVAGTPQWVKGVQKDETTADRPREIFDAGFSRGAAVHQPAESLGVEAQKCDCRRVCPPVCFCICHITAAAANRERSKCCNAPVLAIGAASDEYACGQCHQILDCESGDIIELPAPTSAQESESAGASVQAGPGREHVDFCFDNMDCCKVCGLVRPAEGWTKPCKGPTELSLRDDEPLTDAEVNAFLEAHKDDPVDLARSERIEWGFRQKLGAHWAAQGREYLDNYNRMLAEESRRTAATVSHLYSGTITLIEGMVRAIETLALKPVATPTPTEPSVEQCLSELREMTQVVRRVDYPDSVTTRAHEYGAEQMARAIAAAVDKFYEEVAVRAQSKEKQ